jgi:CheY-like chemotaxis protein
VGGNDLLQAVESLGLAPSNAGHAPHVLVVDDDPRAVEHVSKRLEQAGLAITRAYGGRDALAAVAVSSFSAVVLDLMMPEVSGFDVIRELRAHRATTDLPIIVLTAKFLDPTEQAKLTESVHSVLGKGSWDESKFLQVIRSAIHVALRNKSSRSQQPSVANP